MKVKMRNGWMAQPKRRKQEWLPLVVLLGGVLLVLAGVVATISTTPSASAAYNPADVAHELPILAVHDMGEGVAIPFLPRSQPQPTIQLSERFYSFGAIGPRDVVEREFVIRNTGDAPLTISRAYTTCGCTIAEISASVIPPGKVATVRLVFDAGFHDAAGQTVRRGLIIESNDPNQSQAEIWVQATVRTR